MDTSPISTFIDKTKAEENIKLLLEFISEVAKTIRLNTPYYQGFPLPLQSTTNVLWLAELLAGLNDLSKALQANDTNQINQSINELTSYWLYYRKKIDGARISTPGDNLKWQVDDGLRILTDLRQTYCSHLNDGA